MAGKKAKIDHIASRVRQLFENRERHQRELLEIVRELRKTLPKFRKACTHDEVAEDPTRTDSMCGGEFPAPERICGSCGMLDGGPNFQKLKNARGRRVRKIRSDLFVLMLERLTFPDELMEEW